MVLQDLNQKVVLLGYSQHGEDSNYLHALRDSVLDRDSHYISKKTTTSQLNYK